jgi:hypothetical protein
MKLKYHIVSISSLLHIFLQTLSIVVIQVTDFLRHCNAFNSGGTFTSHEEIFKHSKTESFFTYSWTLKEMSTREVTR